MLQVPSPAPARQELARLSAGDPQQLVAAMQDKRVADSSMEEVKEVLRYAMMKLGLRGQNLPSEIEKMLIIHHVFSNYGGHSLDEIRFAFDLAILRKLDVDPQCYENFSCDYISRIMAAYRKWAAQEARELPTPPPELPPVVESLSPFAMLRWLVREIRFIKTGKPVDFVPPELYDYLDKRGAIKATIEQKYEYIQKAVSRRLGELAKEATNSSDALQKYEQFKRMTEKGCLNGIEVARAKLLAKKLLFFDLAQNHKRCE